MKVAILGASATKFGELWDKSLTDLALMAASSALLKSQLKINQIDALFVSNMLAGKLDNQVHLGSTIAQSLDFSGPSFRIEAACASGGIAVHQAILSLLSGEYQKVLVVGVEKMTDYPTDRISKALMAAASQEEKLAGLTFPSLFALMAQAYFQKYQAPPESLSCIAVKNHYHAQLNPKAHFSFPISLKTYQESPYVASPLRLFDCSPISDGAAAVVLSRNGSTSGENQGNQVSIIASAQTSGSLSLSQRQDLTSLASVRQAGQKAFSMAKIEPNDIDLAEVHDCFTIAEIMALEALGFYPQGQGHLAASRKETYLNKKLPINPSGGLKACGHPVGATGVKQIVEITQQLQKESGQRQVKKARFGLAQNIGGTGGTAVVHILTNQN